MKCVACSGTGKMHLIFTDEKTNEIVVPFTCIVCKGTGKIDKRVSEDIGNEKGIWCLCPGDKDPYSRFYGDKDHPDIEKSHWRCRKCEKVTEFI